MRSPGRVRDGRWATNPSKFPDSWKLGSCEPDPGVWLEWSAGADLTIVRKLVHATDQVASGLRSEDRMASTWVEALPVRIATPGGDGTLLQRSRAGTAIRCALSTIPGGMSHRVLQGGPARRRRPFA